MSINILHAPEINFLKEYLSTYGSQKFFFAYIRKRESFIGSTESIEFLEEFMQKYSGLEGTDTVFYKL